jgi:hypothetical protein
MDITIERVAPIKATLPNLFVEITLQVSLKIEGLGRDVVGISSNI